MSHKITSLFVVAALLFVCMLGRGNAEISDADKQRFERAMEYEEWDVVKEMVTKNPDFAKYRLSDKRTILHIATTPGQREWMERQHKSDTRVSRRRDCLALLLKNGADIDAFFECLAGGCP